LSAQDTYGCLDAVVDARNVPTVTVACNPTTGQRGCQALALDARNAVTTAVTCHTSYSCTWLDLVCPAASTGPECALDCAAQYACASAQLNAVEGLVDLALDCGDEGCGSATVFCDPGCAVRVWLALVWDVHERYASRLLARGRRGWLSSGGTRLERAIFARRAETPHPVDASPEGSPCQPLSAGHVRWRRKTRSTRTADDE